MTLEELGFKNHQKLVVSQVNKMDLCSSRCKHAGHQVKFICKYSGKMYVFDCMITLRGVLYVACTHLLVVLCAPEEGTQCNEPTQVEVL